MSHDAALPAWIAGGEGSRAFAGRVGDAVLCKDLECRFLYANDAALRALDLFGGAPPIGHRLSELRPIPESSRIEQNDLAVMASGETSVTHEHFVAVAQRRRYLVTRIALRDAGGMVCGLVCLWVEERRNVPAGSKIDAEPALVTAAGSAKATTPRALETNDLLATERSARAQAERAAAARDQFLGIVAHDLRSPLNGIQSWANVLESQLQSMPDPPVLASRAVQGIKNGVEQQVHLIEQLLDATRILNGSVALSIANVAVAPILTSVVNAQGEAAAARGIRIGLDLPSQEAASVTVRADAARVEQFLRLLVSTALRRWPPADTVEVLLAVDGAGTMHLRVGEASKDADVAEATKPIPAGASRQRRADDTEAMDLALARRLIELQGGQMQESAPGRQYAIDVRFPSAPGTDG